ncbi:hypothetical protein [Paractinoplanes hotanensis]|uniref:Uncharacterized protein n=1 Tax=Paractinoplanes hotanensis TaxID=2906497 RepID=A0ABT0Y815_9ACTN|nr:hypothetical protein [Actinoplanes hotanensis]MCM4082186.1 hypothetical protein [Actinoplanes hotanensis]
MDFASLSVETLAYEAIQKQFRNAIVRFLRRRLVAAFPDDWQNMLRSVFKKEWDSIERSSLLASATATVSREAIDDFDLLSVNHFYNVFERFFRDLVDDSLYPPDEQGAKAFKSALLGCLRDIKALRDPISHPPQTDLPVHDALNVVHNATRVLRLLGLEPDLQGLLDVRTELVRRAAAAEGFAKSEGNTSSPQPIGRERLALRPSMKLHQLVLALGGAIDGIATGEDARSLIRELYSNSSRPMSSHAMERALIAVSNSRRLGSVLEDCIPPYLEEEFSVARGYNTVADFSGTATLSQIVAELDGRHDFRVELLGKIAKAVRNRAMVLTLAWAGIERQLSGLLEGLSAPEGLPLPYRIPLEWVARRDDEPVELYDIYRPNFSFRAAMPDRVIGLVDYMRGPDGKLGSPYTPPQKLSVELVDPPAWPLVLLPMATASFLAPQEEVGKENIAAFVQSILGYGEFHVGLA